MTDSEKELERDEFFPTLSLHDALALGEVEAGLLVEEREKSEMEEIERLPILLRILSAARPLASIPTFSEETQEGITPIDEIANEVVARLEDVAATHSVAEGVDVVACHLAPAICRNLSKLSPLKRKRSSITSTAAASPLKGGSVQADYPDLVRWDTSELVVVGSNPRSSIKRRRVSHQVSTGKQDADDIAISEGVMSSDDEDQKGDTASGIKARRLSRRASSELRQAGAEDSQEEVVSKTLSELSALVASALVPVKAHGEGDGENRSGKLALASEDSQFSEPVRRHTDGTRGVMTGSDLGSTVASLMHHAPVLRHQHVANALCRATVPQASSLIKKMGANCPSAVPNLLRGCIDAYRSCKMWGSHSVSNMATSAIKALAQLSSRENCRVLTTLQQEGILLDLQLTLAISHDPNAAVCLLLQHLSSETPDLQEHSSTSTSAPFEIVSNDSLKDVGTQDSDTTLQGQLQTNSDLFVATLALLQDELSSLIQSTNIAHACGRLCLLLRCYGWLFLQCDATVALQPSKPGMAAITSILSVLGEVVAKTLEATNETSIWPREPLSLLFCGLILTFWRLLSLDNIDKPFVDQCSDLVKQCLDCRSKNARYGTLVARFACAFHQKDVESFHTLFMGILNAELCSEMSSIPTAKMLEVCMSQVCERLQEGGYDFDVVLKNALSSNSPYQMLFLLDAMETSNATPLADTKDSIKACLTDILSEANPCASLEDYPKVPEFIVKATKYLATSDINLPVLSPLKLEVFAGKAHFGCYDGNPPSRSIENQVLLQLLYWFAFMDSGSSSSSLFTFDVRVLPLKEMLTYSLQRSSESPGSNSLNTYLFDYIHRHCPEIPRQRKRWAVSNLLTMNVVGRHKQDNAKVKRSLSKALRNAASNNSKDPSGALAEKSFLCARSQLPDSALYSQVVSNLLSTPNAPPPFITYSMLCSDPLVLLKAPMRVWQSLGLRRVVLSTLTSLLESNESVLDSASPSTTGANQLISCRHLLLIRCILVVVSGCEDNKSERGPFACSMTTNFLRMQIAKNPGLLGILVKQSPALPDAAMDWLVEFVPETMDDSGSLMNCLAGSASVTSRLTASAAILRIAIAHGHRDDAATERLVYAALAQLVSSFFLVIGPVGVPVNVLIGDGSGQDVTQTSRKATFRMLRSLVNVRGRMRPRIRSECGLALHKLAGLCKGENLLSGVTGAVLARRKGLLREMFEAVNKAANAMGSGMEV